MPRSLAQAPAAPVTLGERLRRARIVRRMSQEDTLAGLIQHGATTRSQTSISDYETGMTEPSIGTLRAYARLFGTTVSALLGELPDPELGLEATDPSTPMLVAGINISDLSPEAQAEIAAMTSMHVALALAREGKPSRVPAPPPPRGQNTRRLAS